MSSIKAVVRRATRFPLDLVGNKIKSTYSRESDLIDPISEDETASRRAFASEVLCNHKSNDSRIYKLDHYKQKTYTKAYILSASAQAT